MTTEPKKPLKRNWGLWLIIAALVFAVFMAALPSLLGGNSGASRDNSGSSSCSLREYQRMTNPIMDDLNALIEATDLSSVASRNNTYLELNPLMARVNNVECRKEYPLKQETLLFSISHFKDAIDALNKGDIESASQSLDAAILNAERFNDWSVDVGN